MLYLFTYNFPRWLGKYVYDLSPQQIVYAKHVK
jgi:hypothetical protein